MVFRIDMGEKINYYIEITRFMIYESLIKSSCYYIVRIGWLGGRSEFSKYIYNF